MMVFGNVLSTDLSGTETIPYSDRQIMRLAS